MGRTQSGFTLVELVIVLLVMGVLTAIAAPRLASQLSIRSMGSAMTLMETDLKAAQQEALTTSTAVTFTISKTSHSYSVTALRNGTASVIRSVKLSGSPWNCSVDSILEGSSRRLVDTFSLTINGVGSFERDLIVKLKCGTSNGTITVVATSGQIQVE